MNTRMTHGEVLKLVEAFLGDFGMTLHLTAYRTHTGDPFVRPWTGPIAWEISASSSYLKHDELKALMATCEKLGFTVHMGGADDQDRGPLRFERLLSVDAG